MQAQVELLAATPFEIRPDLLARGDPGAACRRAKPRSPPRTPRCSIAARAATSPARRRSGGCGKPISSPSSRRRSSSSRRCSPTWQLRLGELIVRPTPRSASRGQETSAKDELPGPHTRAQERRMSGKVLVTPAELSELSKSEPIVIIDTRDPATYAAGHIPGAVNIHDIFTYLATSTPEGVAAMREKFADDLRRRRPLRQGDRGRLRAVDEHRLRPVLPRLRAAELSRLSEDEDPARRLRRLDGGRPADHHRRADADAEVLPARFRRHGHPGRSAGHEGGGRRSQHRQARHPRRRRVDRRLVVALRQGLLPAQGPHPGRALDRVVPHDEAVGGGADVQVARGDPRRMRDRRRHAGRRRSCSIASRARGRRTRWSRSRKPASRTSRSISARGTNGRAIRRCRSRAGFPTRPRAEGVAAA